MNSSTDDLIDSLASRATPVAPPPRPASAVFGWLVPAISILGAFVVFIGARSDLDRALAEPGFLSRATFLLVGAISSAWLALSAAARATRYGALARAAALTAGILAVAFGAASAGGVHSGAGAGLHCVRNLSLFSTLAVLPFSFVLRRHALLLRQDQVFFAVSACALLADAATRFACRSDGPVHLLVWHAMPVVALSSIALVTSERVVHMVTRSSRERLRRYRESLS